MSVAGLPASVAAFCICAMAHEPSVIAETLPVAMRFLEASQLVVVGSASVSFWCTASYRSESITKWSAPAAHGASFLPSLLSNSGSAEISPRRDSHCVRGQPSL